MKEVIGLLFALYLLYLGADVYITGQYDAYYGYEVDLGDFKYLVSLIFMLLGFYVIYKTIKKDMNDSINNKIDIEFSKCPKCKTSYRYETLKDGICPTCNIKTIETEEYFKKYPDELDDV